MIDDLGDSMNSFQSSLENIKKDIAYFYATEDDY